MDNRAQTATEYLLILALGLVVLGVVLAMSLRMRDFGNVLTQRVTEERNNTLSMLVN